MLNAGIVFSDVERVDTIKIRMQLYTINMSSFNYTSKLQTVSRDWFSKTYSYYLIGLEK